MDGELDPRLRLLIEICVPIIVITLVCGTMYFYHTFDKAKYVENSEFTVVSKQTEDTNTIAMAGKFISSINSTHYIVECENEKYGKVKVESTDLYNSVEDGNVISIKVYERANESYKFIW